MQESPELRTQVARILQGRAADVVAGAVGVYPFAGIEHVSVEDRERLGDLAFQLLITAIRDGELDLEYPVAATLGLFAREREISVRLLFTVLYLMERAALDELAQDESFGIQSEPWPALIQMIHRASLDVCAAASGHARRNGHVIVDPLTTLHTRPVFMAALEKEIQRSERFGYPFTVIVLDVDGLNEINEKHGRGAGDRVIERIGIVLKGFFRDTDWVARLGEDMFGVVMPHIQGANAQRLAERLRVLVHERLRLHDHRSDEAYAVTISIGVLDVPTVENTMRPEVLFAEAEAAVRTASEAGGNRVVSQRLDS